MFKITLMAARNTLLLCLLAVFLSQPLYSANQTLNSVGEGLSNLIFDLSRSIVTVETVERVYPGSAHLPIGEAVQKLASTGLICDSSGHILVAAKNVVGHDQIAVRFGDKLFPASIVAIDYHTDLALLRTDCVIGRSVTFSENQTCAGQMVINLAHSHGMRTSPELGFCAGSRYDGNLQFALKVTPESIGGGVFDLDGKLLGIVIDGVGDNNEIAQAVPGYRLTGIVNHLLKKGDRPAGYIGISSVEIEVYPPLDLPPFAHLDLSIERVLARGVIVTEIVKGSSAELAGMNVGDLIFTYDNQLVSTVTDLANWVKQTKHGTMVIVDILRQKSHFQIHMKIGRKELISQSANAQHASIRDSKGRLVDSLSAELDALKSNIYRLEQQLKQITQ